MRNRYVLILLLCISLLTTGTLAVPSARASAAPGPAQAEQPVIEKTENLRRWEREQERAKNKRRHEDLKKDTDKLLQLATDLKVSVDKSNEQTLSIDVLKKAGEVEKLAKEIQRKMKGD